MLPLDEITAPLIGSLIAGGLIGLEREWRGRPAGFRTHILVSLSSCLLMLAALHQTHWAFDDLPRSNIMTDPTRMAHGVLTGIGFLCAGVIFRQGFSVHGLTTAASLWMTAAIGLLYGAGLFGLATTGTLITGVILIALKLISDRVPARLNADLQVRWKRGNDHGHTRIRNIVAHNSYRVQSIRYALSADGTSESRNWRLQLRNRSQLDALSSALSADDMVLTYRLETHDD